MRQPSHPSDTQERAARFHYVTWDGTDPVHPEDLIGGEVYVTPQDKAVLWNAATDKCAQKARYINKSPEELFPRTKKGRAAAFDDIRDVGDAVSPEDRKQMLRDYYGEQRVKIVCGKTFG